MLDMKHPVKKRRAMYEIYGGDGNRYESNRSGK